MKISIKKLRSILSQAVPNLKDPRIQLMLDCGNLEYYPLRAIELIKRGEYIDAITLLGVSEICKSQKLEQLLNRASKQV